MADQRLRDFVENNSLPVRVKVTEGFYSPEKVEWEFSNGDTLDLQRIVCPTVRLSFVDPDTGEEKCINVSTWSPCLFKILPYIPGQPVEVSKPMVLYGVIELSGAWPSVVCARSDYADGSGASLKKGDKLRLKRIVDRGGLRFLECSTQYSKLVQLSVSCDTEFLLVEDTTAYTLSEIADMPGRVERRLRLSEDIINKTSQIQGLPADFIGDLMMSMAEQFIEVHPVESPGDQIIVPLDLDLTVSYREGDYMSASFRWYPLAKFVEDNHNLFPAVVEIADWKEEPVTIQAIRASVSDRIVLHLTEEVYKVVCYCNQRHFVVPVTYDAPFEAIPRTFQCIKEVIASRVGRVKVTQTASSSDSTLSGVNKGETLEVMFDGHPSEVVLVQKQDRQHQLPVNLGGQYEEIINLQSTKRGMLTEINPSLLPLSVTFNEPAVSIPPRKDVLPRGKRMQLLFLFKERCVRTSKNTDRGFSSPVPLRSGINVRYITPYRRKVPVPDISSLASCPEEITDDILLELEAETVAPDYQLIEDNEPPPLLPRFSSPSSQTLSFIREKHGLRTSRVNCPLPPVPEASATLPHRRPPTYFLSQNPQPGSSTTLPSRHHSFR